MSNRAIMSACSAVIVVVAAACAGGDDAADPGTTDATEEESSSSTVGSTETSPPTETTAATTTPATTIDAECLNNAVRFPASGRERCVDGQWESFPITTDEPPPSTERPPTTVRRTTTTVDPAVEADIQALFLLGGIESGEAADIIKATVELLEPFTLDRVDLVTADVPAANIVIVGTSGYSTEEIQLESTVDTLSALAELWDAPQLAGTGSVKVGLDLTVDGRRFVIPNESMIAVMNRRMTPQAALGM